jgi:N-acetylglucosaminyldiphosphoundecaprenol N-acetyl-beta-D-mannosaminyltransferase
MRTIDLLGTPLSVTNYAELIAESWRRAKMAAPCVIDFSNTQIVTLRRSDPAFRELTRDVDVFVPDGMPLIWCLNRRGAELTDRVYGPTFMRHLLDDPPDESTHYLLGGSEECGRRLRERFPRARIVGAFHGRCNSDGVLEGTADATVLDGIRQLAPDYIWVGLGTPKQYGWIHRNKHQLARGVILAVGFAFDVNSGMKRDAPMWAQRLGLTWVFRLLSEPRRLARRYLRYNTLFLYYLARDAFRKTR